MKFTKMHGLGNDYLYVYGEVPGNAAELSKKLSERHLGAGSDGMIYISKSSIADFKMRIFNADGSEAKMCGNGIRCVGKYVYDKGYTDKKFLRIETLSGVKYLTLQVTGGKVKTVTVDMGQAKAEKQEQFRNSFIAPSAKVLVVDDNPVNIKIAAGYLKSYKIEADSALGGLECVEKVSKTRYDIVLLDYMMPEVDGVDTLNLIRAKSGEDEYYKKLPIVALTADAVNGSEEKFKNFGFNEYLAKPINEGKLEDVLAKFLPPEIVAINAEIDDEEIEKADVDFEIEGVNTEIGLDNCGNELEDYIEILGIFSTTELSPLLNKRRKRKA